MTSVIFRTSVVKSVSILLIVSISVRSKAQDQRAIDSLVYELSQNTGEKKVDVLANLFWQHRGVDNKKAAEYSEWAFKEATELNNKSALAKAYHLKGVLQESLGEFKKAEQFLNLFLEAALSLGDTALIAGALNSLGTLNHKQSNYQQALDFFMQRISFLKPGDQGALATNYNNIGLIHEAIDNNSKALEYFGKAIDLHRSLGNTRLEGGTLANMGVVYFNMKEYDKALEHYGESIFIIQRLGDKGILSILYESIGNVYKEQAKYTAAIKSYNDALALSEALGDDYGIASVNRNLGEAYMLEKKYSRAVTHLLKSRALSEKTGGKSFVMNADRLLAQAYAEMNDHKKAYAYLNSFQALRDTLFNENKNEQIQELQTRYETEKKNQEIVLLNTERELQATALQKERMIRNLSVIGITLIAAIAFMVIKNFRQKSKAARQLALKNDEINKQKIAQLEKDKKLEIMDAMISAEEKERKRIAEDLHDGLSGLLAATKMQFDSVQRETETVRAHPKFSHALQSLDNASGEVRRIAHNMMPEILMKYGLVDALSEFITNIRAAHHLNITFEHTGMQQGLTQTQELIIYRVLQELVSNIVKHAAATEVLIQLNITNDTLLVTVEDNGIGFNTKTANRSNGIGISNITSRVQYMGGDLKIDSMLGKGTSVYIEIELNNKITADV